ncbi:MAG: hypothetical protein IKR39_03210 [Lachnospiraceae bacterium]|nr:hypothetical protein [Lachnospiraceae bacterium]
MSMKRNHFSQADWALDLRSEAQKRANMLKSAVREAEDYVKRAPQGMLRDIKHRNSFQYFWRKEKSDTNGTYLPASSETKIIRELAQKDYCLKFIKEAKEELRFWDKYLSMTEKRNVEAVYKDMSEARKMYTNPFITPDDLYIRQWEDRKYEPGYFAPDYPEYYSAKGERVRSKAEENIANLLILNKVPYHYECPFIIGGEERRPDFYCLNVRTKKEYLWEHFGMMDNTEYARNNVEKINKMAVNGHVHGQNCIFTFETSVLPLNTKVIQLMIEKFLL